MAESRRTIGIDPGTARLGYAVVESNRSTLSLITCGVISTPATEKKMENRLLAIYAELSDLVGTHHPHDMAVEELFFAKNVTTAVAVGQARGVALLVAAQAGLTLAEY